MNSVKLGVIGCGSVAQNAYLPLASNLRARGEVNAIVVADPDVERLARAGERFELEAVSTSNKDILGDPDVEVVAILTSMNQHAELTIAALEAGKHVLVEKPMATTLEDGRAVLAAAEASSGHLVCAPHIMLSPDYQAMLRLVRGDAVGRVLLGRARYGWEGPDWSAWFYAPGGGPLFDLGVYNVTSLTGLLGPAVRVSCMSRLSRPTREVDGQVIDVRTEDTFQLTLEHVDGALSSVTTAFGMQKYRNPAIELYGLDGTVQMMGDDWAPAGLELYTNDVGNWQVLESEARYWPWTDGLAHLVSAVRSGPTPYSSPRQAFHVLEIMLAAMESARTGSTQTVTSRFEPLAPQPAKERRAAHLIHDRVHEEAQ
jgi:predicted dehydrogenase